MQATLPFLSASVHEPPPFKFPCLRSCLHFRRKNMHILLFVVIISLHFDSETLARIPMHLKTAYKFRCFSQRESFHLSFADNRVQSTHLRNFGLNPIPAKSLIWGLCALRKEKKRKKKLSRLNSRGSSCLNSAQRSLVLTTTTTTTNNNGNL